MAVTQADIDAINQALKNGERVVRSGDTYVEYRSVKDLIDARNSLQAQLTAETEAASGNPRPRQTILVHGGRGFRGSQG